MRIVCSNILKNARITRQNSKQKRYFELYDGLAGSVSSLNILKNPDTSVKYAKSVSLSYLAVYPPSTGIFVPVTYNDASEAKNTMMPFKSSSFAIRPSNVLSLYRLTNSSG